MRLKSIYESIEIVPWTDDPIDYNYDPWIAADQADKVANISGIRISRNKELTWIAINDNDDVVAALWSHLSNDDPPEYDFDLAVDPKWRTNQIGLKLIDKAIEDLKIHQSEFPGTYARVWVVNPKLVRVLENRYGFEIESQYPDGSAHMKFE